MPFSWAQCPASSSISCPDVHLNLYFQIRDLFSAQPSYRASEHDSIWSGPIQVPDILQKLSQWEVLRMSLLAELQLKKCIFIQSPSFTPHVHGLERFTNRLQHVQYVLSIVSG